MKSISSLLIKDTNDNNLVSLIYPRSQSFNDFAKDKNFTQKVISTLKDLKKMGYHLKNISSEKRDVFLNYIVIVEKI